MPRLRRHAGFAYLGALFLIAILGMSLAGSGMLWSTVQKREKERELLFVGGEFRKAITTYYEATPGIIKRYPSSLNDLVLDNRQLTIVRHLRKIFIDPLTLKTDWGLVRAPDGGVMGVYSLSTDRPLKQGNFPPEDVLFLNAKDYRNWKFVVE